MMEARSILLRCTSHPGTVRQLPLKALLSAVLYRIKSVKVHFGEIHTYPVHASMSYYSDNLYKEILLLAANYPANSPTEASSGLSTNVLSVTTTFPKWT